MDGSDNSPIFSSVFESNSESTIIYDIFQLLEKALAKVIKEDILNLEGNMDKLKYMEYLTGHKPLEIQPNQFSDMPSKQLLLQIIDKNITNKNVLTAAFNLKILYNNDNLGEKSCHMVTVDNLKRKKITFLDPNKNATNRNDNNDIDNVEIKTDTITIDINKFTNSSFLLRICPFEEIEYTEKEKELFSEFIENNDLQTINEEDNNYDLFDYYNMNSFEKYMFLTNFEIGMQGLIENFVLYGTRRDIFLYVIYHWLNISPYYLSVLRYEYQREQDKNERKRKEDEEKAKERKKKKKKKKKKEETKNTNTNYYFYYDSYEEERKRKEKEKIEAKKREDERRRREEDERRRREEDERRRREEHERRRREEKMKEGEEKRRT